MQGMTRKDKKEELAEWLMKKDLVYMYYRPSHIFWDVYEWTLQSRPDGENDSQVRIWDLVVRYVLEHVPRM
jgi:hypothetical protein